MPDVAILPLAIIGLVAAAGGGGYMWRAIKGGRKRKTNSE